MTDIPPGVLAGRDGPLTTEARDAWIARPAPARLADNLARLDDLVVSWDAISAGAGRGVPVIFLHVPKTGGTTLQEVLVRNTPAGRLHHLHNNRLRRDDAAMAAAAADLWGVHLPGDPPQRRRPARPALVGHHQIDHALYQLPGRPFVNITLLRHPVERVISHYHFLLDSPNHGGHAKVADLTLSEYVERDVTKESSNGQARRLGLGTGARRGDVADDELRRAATTNLRDRFSFFGVTERYDAFLVACSRVLGWENIFYTRRKVGVSRRRSPVDAATIALIEERNRVDLELYEFAKQLLERRLDELAIASEDVARFSAANETYGELLAERW